MRYSQSEKMEIIRLVENSDLPVKRTLEELQVNRGSFYNWYQRYHDEGYDGLAVRKPSARKFWNRIPDHEKERIVSLALKHPEKSSRELAWYITDRCGFFVSESSVYRILKAYDLVPSPAYIVMAAGDSFQNPTKRVHELWQTDFTYLKVITWGWYFLGSVLDDFSRYIISWKLFPTMSTTDVKELLDMAVDQTGVQQVAVRHRPRLLSDNGPCYVSGELKEYLKGREMDHTRGRPYHPMTQGKIERYHRSMKNVVKLQHYYFPGELEEEIRRFVDYYNNERYHESLNNVTPADVYFGRHREIETRRDRIKRRTLERRRKLNLHPNQLQHKQPLTLSKTIS